jgi:hypothetical protein
MSVHAQQMVEVPLVTHDAKLMPIHLLLPGETYHELLPQYLTLVSHDKFDNSAGTLMLCAQVIHADKTSLSLLLACLPFCFIIGLNV